MANSINKAIIIGNVGTVNEARKVGDDKVIRFSVATSKVFGRGDDRREETTWHMIVAWGVKADIVEKYIQAGTQVYVEGEIMYRKYTNQSGVEQRTTEIQASEIRVLSKGKESGERRAEAQPQSARPAVKVEAPAEDEGDDLPF